MRFPATRPTRCQCSLLTSTFDLCPGPQDAFPPPTHPSAARADARIFSFPCGAPYQQQLLHVVASGALTDPWVRVRAGDYGNLALVVSQLLAILVAVLLPRIYVRVRHWLLFAVNAVVLVAVAASVAWTPAALLPVGAASHLGPYWGSVMVLYLAWKSVYVLRVSVRRCMIHDTALGGKLTGLLLHGPLRHFLNLSCPYTVGAFGCWLCHCYPMPPYLSPCGPASYVCNHGREWLTQTILARSVSLQTGPRFAPAAVRPCAVAHDHGRHAGRTGVAVPAAACLNS